METRRINDEFLYKYRRSPDPRFARSLYRRISAGPRIRIMPLFAPAAQIARTLNLLGMAAAVALAISPDLRSRVLKQMFEPIIDPSSWRTWQFGG